MSRLSARPGFFRELLEVSQRSGDFDEETLDWFHALAELAERDPDAAQEAFWRRSFLDCKDAP